MNQPMATEAVATVATHGGDPAAGEADPTRVGWAVATGVFLLLVADLPNLSTGPWASKAAVLSVLGFAGLPFLVWRAVGRGTSRRSTAEVWAARAAAAFVVVAGFATIGATRPVLAVVGLYQLGTGLLFVVAIAGCWALGTILGQADRRVLVTAIIAGSVVNAVVGILQVVVGLQNVGLPLYAFQEADGLLTNPVHLGALLAATLVLVAERFRRRSGSVWVTVGVLGAGVGVTGSRMPALLVLAVAAWVLWRSRSRRSQDGAIDRSARARAFGFGALSLGGVAAGSALTLVRSSTGVVAQAANSTVNETFGERISAWAAGLHAIAHKPLLGAGPGQFREATSALFSLSYVRQNGGAYFLDAHNILIEYAVTTGLIGTFLLVGWLTLSGSTGRGPLLGFAAVLVVSALIEPLNPVTTPLMVLTIGAAALTSPDDQVALATGPIDPLGKRKRSPAAPSPLPRRLVQVSVILAALSGVAALDLVVGDAALQRSYSEYSVAQDAAAQSAASTANDLLMPWPEPASQLGAIHQYLGIDVRFPVQKREAVDWRRQAVLRDPTNWMMWTSLAQAQALDGQLGDAKASARAALRFFPHDVAALALLGTLAAAQHQSAVAHGWFGRALAVEPGDAGLRALYEGRCQPALPGARPSSIPQGCAGPLRGGDVATGVTRGGEAATPAT